MPFKNRLFLLSSSLEGQVKEREIKIEGGRGGEREEGREGGREGGCMNEFPGNRNH